MKKAVKKIISTILGIIFIVIVVVGVIICTYTFSTPSKEGDSREIILGDWIDYKQNVMFRFSDTGDFTMLKYKDEKEGDTIAKGYFKIDEDSKKIKILVVPKDRDDSYDIGLKYKFFTTISYSDLSAADTLSTAFKTTKDTSAICNFMFVEANKMYQCDRINTKESFYGNKNEDLKH